jgi:predicted DNA-binding protein YlxM (UPF0122 family)
MKAPLQSNLSLKKSSNQKLLMADSKSFLVETLESLNPEGVYVLDTFSAMNANEQNRFMRADTSTCFSLSEVANNVSISNEKIGNQKTTGVSFDDHIKLVRDLAMSEAKCSALRIENEHLQEKVNKLTTEIEELEEELDEMDEEEGDKASMGSAAAPVTWQDSLGKILAEAAPAIIKNMTGKVKSDKVEEDVDNMTVNGVDTQKVTMQAIIDGLRKHDKDLFNHLYKLWKLAEQKPEMFKALISNLDSF